MTPEIQALIDKLNAPICKVVYARPKKYRAIVTYARPKQRNQDDSGASIQAYYDECRSKYQHGAGVWVGD